MPLQLFLALSFQKLLPFLMLATTLTAVVCLVLHITHISGIYEETMSQTIQTKQFTFSSKKTEVPVINAIVLELFI